MCQTNLKRIFALKAGIAPTLLLIFLLAAPTQAQNSPMPQFEQIDIPDLIRESDINGAAMHKRLLEYTYIQKRISREVGHKGKLIEQIREFEAYPTLTKVGHRHILILIKKDDVSVSPQELERYRQFAAREMERAERRETPGAETGNTEKYITAGIGIGSANEGVWLGVSQFLRQCRFDSPHRLQLNNRETVALTLHSCSGNSLLPGERYLAKMTGVVWIDVADKVVIRLEAWPASPLSDAEHPPDVFAARPIPEIILYEQQIIFGEIWAPRRIRLNGIGNATIFNGVDKDMTFEFMDYRHFSTEIKERQ